jgi:aryl-alcohol dehydrogenase-like predicted oxidoreductase
MEQRAFGNSGLTVPAVGMGTWQTLDVRGEADVAARGELVRRAIDAGITLFDTSPMYGRADQVLAKGLGDARGRVLVADKVWARSTDQGRDQVRWAMDWYGGRVDIYQVHNLVAWREHLPMLEALREEGSVAVVGATHYQHSAFPELMEVMRTGRIQMVQIPYNAVDRVVEGEVLPLAAELGLGVMVMQPLGTGPLARRSPPARDVERLADFGVTTWAQALLKWILSDPRVHCVIPATRRLERVAENAAAGDAPWFDPDTREYVARLAAG